MSIKLKDTIYDLINKATKDGSGNIITSTYLKLSGGTITNDNYGPLTIERSGSTNMAAIKFKNSSGELGSIGMNEVSGDLKLYNADTTAFNTILDSENYSSYAATKNHTHSYAELNHTHSQYYDSSTSRTKNTVLAAPNGTNGSATFRTLVAADLPSHTHSDYASSSHTHNYAGSSSPGGAATSALTITGSAPQLAAASESNNINIVNNANGSITVNSTQSLAACTKAISFRWYDTYWQIGNIRSGSTDSDGFGITYGNNNLRFRVTTDNAYIGGSTIIHTGNYSTWCAAKSHTHNYAGSSSAGGVATSAAKLATARTIWGQSFNGTANVDGTLHLKATGNSYTQGIRIYQNSTSYAGILLGSSSLTASTGSDNNSWFICTDSHSNFSISKGGYLPTDNTCFGWDANENKWRINGASIIDINTESSESSSISLNSSKSCLKLFAWSDGSTYIESGNKDFTANMPLRITGINGGNGSDLYLNFDNVRANGVVRASSGYVALGSHGTLLSLGAYSRTRVITTGWTASESDFTTIYIPGSSNSNDAYLKIRQYDLIYNGNTVIHSGNISNYVTGSSGTSYLGVQDTRNDNTNSHSGRLSWHLKYNSSVGLSAANGSTYSGVLQLSPWGDASGGVNYQVAFCGNGNDILYRSNTGTWHRILDSNNYSSYCMSANYPTGSGTLMMNGSNSRGSFPAVKWHIPNVNWAQILMNGSGELEFRGGAGQDTGYITTRVGAMVCTSLYVGGEQITFTT